MEKISRRSVVMDYLYIMIGTAMLAVSISVFFDPLAMVTGGVTGLAIVIKNVTSNVIEGGIPLWFSNLVINIPLFIIAIFIKGKSFGKRSLFATVFLSFCLFFTQHIPPITLDVLLGSIFGGVLSGAGLGLVFSAYSTTGGTDLAASSIQHFMKHISVAKIMLVLDGIIVLLGFFIFGPEKTMYAIISIFISAKVIDAFLEGLHFSKAAFIISDQHDQIAKGIMEEMERGVTGLTGVGKYTGNSKEVLLCVVSKREIVKVKEIAHACDRHAFVIVADVREVLGEGFIEYDHKSQSAS